MRTKGQAFVDDLQSAVEQLKLLEDREHDPQDITDILVQAGTRMEFFFKDALFPDSTKQDDANSVINRLKSIGVAKGVREDLHAARVACNDSKHDPRFGISIPFAVDVLEKAVVAVDELIRLNVDGIQQPFLRGPMRSYWIAAWDHFIHGDIEIHVTLPYLAKGSAPTFDIYNIDCNSWESLKGELGDSLLLGREAVSSKFYDDCAGEGDFFTAGEFQGEYRVLSAALSARLMNENQLLPGLRRQDNALGVVAALCMAAVDAARSAPALASIAELEEAILKVSEEQYAIVPTVNLAIALAPALATLFLALPEKARASASGPIWVDELGFDRYSARGGMVDAKRKIGIDSHGVLFVLLNAPSVDSK